MNILPLIFAAVLAVAAFALYKLTSWVLSLRRVVASNEVHIVQTRRNTLSYGFNQVAGNTYYAWPDWIPVLGVSVIELPTSVFPVELESYDAYDKERLPFVVDVVAFFRVVDSNQAANRVASVEELQEQLKMIVQGSVRSIMANQPLENIMSERRTYGDLFTQEVVTQLKEWGVETVKNIELMDIRDAKGGNVIENIMAKRKSFIDMESRSVVAGNEQKAREAEIASKQLIELRQQEAVQAVGLRQAAVTQEVGIANEKSKQEIQEQQRTTKEKEMAVVQVAEVRKAEITKAANVVKAEEQKQVVVLAAEANLEAQRKDAEGIRAQGEAKADAEKAMQLAPVQAQIVLAKEIGENSGYQTYLVTIEGIKANQAVGTAQAQNLGKAEIKIIANAGDVQNGVKSALEVFTPKGGTAMGGMLEALAQTDVGKSLLDRVLSTPAPKADEPKPAKTTKKAE